MTTKTVHPVDLGRIKVAAKAKTRVATSTFNAYHPGVKGIPMVAGSGDNFEKLS